MGSRLKMDSKEKSGLSFLSSFEDDEIVISSQELLNGNRNDKEEPKSSCEEMSHFCLDSNGDNSEKQDADPDKGFVDVDIQSSSSSEYSSETIMFKKLPEIWDESILSMLSPADFQSLINASPELRQMFMVNSMTCKRLLPLVLPILLKHWTVSKDSILVWRKLSKECQRVIDGVLEEATSPQKYYDDLTKKHLEWSPLVTDMNHHRREVISRIQKPYDFRFLSSSLANFTKSFLPASILDVETVTGERSSPIITNCIDLTLGSNISQLPFRLLTKYGAKLSTVSLGINRHISVDVILSALSHLANVKVIKIRTDDNYPLPHEQQLVQLRPFELPRLELLDVGEFKFATSGRRRDQYEEVLSAILGRCGPQLKRLICSAQLFMSERTMELLTSGQLSNIRFLSILGTETRTLTALQRLGTVLQLEEVQLRNYFNLNNTQIEDVIKALSPFATTLTKFQLCVPDVGYSRGITMTPVYPKLTKFSTYVSHSQSSSFDFWAFVHHQFENLIELCLYEAAATTTVRSMEAFARNNEPIARPSYNYDEMKLGFRILPKLKKIVVYVGYENNAGSGKENAFRVEMYRDGTVKKFKFRRILDANSARCCHGIGNLLALHPCSSFLIP